ncbi:MAG: DUF6984 family protein [Planctomycetales bacterium]
MSQEKNLFVSAHRRITDRERALIACLLESTPLARHLIDSLDDMLVTEMADGGMGSLVLIPKGFENVARRFGEQVALGVYIDADGVPVSVALNLDQQKRLYELDLWKVNFTPVLRLPDPAEVRLTDVGLEPASRAQAQ